MGKRYRRRLACLVLTGHYSALYVNNPQTLGNLWWGTSGALCNPFPEHSGITLHVAFMTKKTADSTMAIISR